MRNLLIIIILAINITAFGQQFANKGNVNYSDIDRIALMEQQAHARLPGSPNQAFSSQNFDVKHYRCEWSVDPAIRFISGSITSYFQITSATNSISYDLMDTLTVDSVLHLGSLIAFTHASDILQITLPSTEATGSFDSVSVYYHGAPANTGFGSFVQTTHAGVPVIWTLSEPYGARDWWPCKNGLDDKADSIDVTVIHPAAYKAASNGLLQSETTDGTTTITHWKHKYPIATYLVCFALTNYARMDTSVYLPNENVTLPMVTFCYPEDLPAFQANTHFVLNTLKFYDSTFGTYPFIKEKYGHVEFSWGGGQEHQTSTFIIRPDESLMAHELGHQWFGDKVTCGSWHDAWLNEGFATHLASMYMERQYPANTSTNRKSEIDNITSIPNGSVWVNDTTNVSRIFDGRLTYKKGSHLLYMLNWILGDAFFTGLKSYLADPALAYGFATTPDLQRNLEAASGVNLDYFFKQWFYGQGYPSYNVKWEQLGTSFVRVNLSQTTSDTSVSFFQLHVALKFQNSTQQKTVILNNTANGQYFYEDIGFIADTVLVDPDYWLITNNNTTQKVSTTVTGSNVINVFPNPFHDQFYVYLSNITQPNASLNLFNEAGQLVYQRSVPVSNSEFISIPATVLSKGGYILKVIVAGQSIYTTKLLKL